ncbi:MAG: 3-hydroxylacyl-ACP dehydratase [Nitrospira sp. CG24A]|nr:MAG: 3-hydroxylacyl-ACP dehydratase [Nitrospira sp. CG24A]
MLRIGKAAICRLIPHHGTMCLLNAVEQWNDTSILCTTASHRDATNPLRRNNRLEAICGLEYAAQAMAVHVGLLQPRKEHRLAVGYLGAVKNLMLQATRLDNVKADLTVHATRLVGEAGCFIYTFRVSAERQELLEGRASIFLKYRDHQL